MLLTKAPYPPLMRSPFPMRGRLIWWRLRRLFRRGGFSYRQPSPRGEGAPQGRIGHRRHERQMRKAERCAAYVWKRESLTAKDNDLIRVSLKIIRAPSSGRGRRAKRGGVGFPESGSTVTRGQPPPLRCTSFQRKAGEKEGLRVSSLVYLRRSRHLNPEPNESKVKRGCEEMRIHFFTAPFLWENGSFGGRGRSLSPHRIHASSFFKRPSLYLSNVKKR